MTTELRTEQSEFKELVTEIFHRYCEAQNLTVLFAPIDNHGSDVWEAGITTDFYRFVSIAATPLHQELPAMVLHGKPGDGTIYLSNGEFIVEYFYGGATDRYLLREQEYSFTYDPMGIHSFLAEVPIRSPEELSRVMAYHLEGAWKQAAALTIDEISKRAREQTAS